MNTNHQIDERQLRVRIAGRKEAAETAQFVVDVVKDAMYRRRDLVLASMIVGAVREALDSISPAPPTPRSPICPMNDMEARVFEENLMPYGKHRGENVGSVPLDYLLWLADNKDDFHGELRRYCLSRRVQDEQDSPAETAEMARHGAG